nr:hypothetical protein HmN_000947000 [Hymenolepis microstoma]
MVLLIKPGELSVKQAQKPKRQFNSIDLERPWLRRNRNRKTGSGTVTLLSRDKPSAGPKVPVTTSTVLQGGFAGFLEATPDALHH